MVTVLTVAGVSSLPRAFGVSVLTIDDELGRSTDIGLTLTGEAARRLADVLITAADEVDGWVQR